MRGEVWFGSRSQEHPTVKWVCRKIVLLSKLYRDLDQFPSPQLTEFETLNSGQPVVETIGDSALVRLGIHPFFAPVGVTESEKLALLWIAPQLQTIHAFGQKQQQYKSLGWRDCFWRQGCGKGQ